MEVRTKMIVAQVIATVTVKVVIQIQVPQGPVNMKVALKTKVLDNLVKVQNQDLKRSMCMIMKLMHVIITSEKKESEEVPVE